MNTSITAREMHQRQITLLGADNHQKIVQSRILVVGAGGLGCPALQYLAAAGVGELGIVDFDTVSVSNLQRQILFSIADVGENKSKVACSKLSELAPYVKFHSFPVHINASNVASIIESYDVVLDCTDNFLSKFLLHDTCFQLKKVLIQASVYQYEGQLHVFDFRKQQGPCWRCLWPEPPHDGCTGTCAEVGVLGPLLGVMGSMQAMEALKLVTNQEHLPNGTSLFVDLKGLAFDQRKFKHLNDCPCCVKKVISQDNVLQIQLPSDLEQYIILDVRSPEETSACPFVKGLKQHQRLTSIPLEKINEFIPEPESRYLAICARGIRALKASQEIRKNHAEIYSLIGGINGVLNERR